MVGAVHRHVGEDVRHRAGPVLSPCVAVADAFLEIFVAHDREVARPSLGEAGDTRGAAFEIQVGPYRQPGWLVAESREPELARADDMSHPPERLGRRVAGAER